MYFMTISILAIIGEFNAIEIIINFENAILMDRRVRSGKKCHQNALESLLQTSLIRLFILGSKI